MMNITYDSVMLINAMEKRWETREDKLYQLGLENLSHEYKEALDVKKKIPCSNEMNNLEEVMTRMEIISNELFYRRGFMDGAKIIIEILIS